jgi:hypothetical protein
MAQARIFSRRSNHPSPQTSPPLTWSWRWPNRPLRIVQCYAEFHALFISQAVGCCKRAATLIMSKTVSEQFKLMWQGQFHESEWPFSGTESFSRDAMGHAPPGDFMETAERMFVRTRVTPPTSTVPSSLMETVIGGSLHIFYASDAGWQRSHPERVKQDSLGQSERAISPERRPRCDSIRTQTP